MTQDRPYRVEVPVKLGQRQLRRLDAGSLAEAAVVSRGRRDGIYN